MTKYIEVLVEIVALHAVVSCNNAQACEDTVGCVRSSDPLALHKMFKRRKTRRV